MTYIFLKHFRILLFQDTCFSNAVDIVTSYLAIRLDLEVKGKANRMFFLLFSAQVMKNQRRALNLLVQSLQMISQMYPITPSCWDEAAPLPLSSKRDLKRQRIGVLNCITLRIMKKYFLHSAQTCVQFVFYHNNKANKSKNK